MKRSIALLASLMLLFFAASDGVAAKNRSMNKVRESTLYDYASTIHWSDFDKAVAFVDPLWLTDHPLSKLDMERYEQVHVTDYDVRTTAFEPDGSYDQVVVIRLINVNTQVERKITDNQHWRWDPEAKHWWLTTGLPDITASDE